MPTGYTHEVQTGKVTTLNEFAMICARAMGACVTMRDDSSDVEIPERFEPNTKYHDEQIDEANALLDSLVAMNISDAGMKATKEYEESVASIDEYIQNKKNYRTNYESMIKKVSLWEVSGDVAGLKDFMLSQLTQSIDFDCSDYAPELAKKIDGATWIEDQRSKAIRDIDYHTQERQKEIARVRDRNQFLSDLRLSLAEGKGQ